MMKNSLLFTILGAFVLFGCAPPCPECPTVDMSSYENNKATLEKMFAGFESQELDSTILAENFVEIGTGYEEPDRNKEESMENWNGMMSMMSMNLKNAVYLPGVDTANFALDGSVRYYGTWEMTMGEASKDLMAYGSMDFNDEGQITNLQHYADFTATVEALMAENPEMMEMMMQMTEEE
jgi:hypothetical protein